MSQSLQFRLSLWLLLTIVVAGSAAAVFSYCSAYAEAIELQDDQLREAAALAGQLSPSAADAARIASANDHEARIVVGRVGGQGALPPELRGLPAVLTPGFHTERAGAREWRVFVTDPNQMLVAQSTALRDDVAQDGAERALLPFAVVLPLLLLVVTVIVRRMLAPLRALAAAVDARKDDDLSAIGDAGLPIELRPLVGATNRLLDRIGQAMAAQQRFIADAAHELRTPLAALILQAERLDGADLSTDARDRLGLLRRGLARSRSLLEQLLALARAQQAAVNPAAATPLGPVLRAVIAEQMPLAVRKRIDLGVIGEPDVTVAMGELDVSILLRNLVENALRYTPEAGRVDVVVARAGHRVTIAVRDTGPGIPVEERERVFQPFHRLAADDQGSGLGLAIVRAIAERNGATVTIGDAQPGASISITLPDTNEGPA